MANTNTVVVKVQVPLESSSKKADETLCLVYDKDRKNMAMQPISPKTHAAMRGDERAFFEAEFEGGRWSITTRRLPEQFW